MPDFLDLLSQRVVVCDGGMGTMLYSKGVFINQCFDELNVKSPSLVEEVHREYAEAGADILETNTFGANRPKLGLHGLESRVAEINRAGVRLARKVAGSELLVAGAIGPLGTLQRVSGGLSSTEMEELFREQALALAEAGVDLFILETISDLDEMEAAIRAVRSIDQLPLVAQMTYTEEALTLGGDTPEAVVERLRPHAPDVLGTNCTIGPKPMLEIVQRLAAVHDGRLSAQPNAGFPESVEGRLIYMAAPEYLAKYAKRFAQAGVTLVGGCCGTRPEHVRAMKHAVSPFTPMRAKVVVFPEPAPEKEPVQPTPTREKSRLAALLAEGQRLVTSVELTPPPGFDLRKLLEGVRTIQEAGVDCVNIPEYARVNPRLTPITIARLLRPDFTVEPIVHYCCRDRNLSGMQADLLGAEAFGIHNVLIITGDPPKLGDYPKPTAVFDLDAIGLVKVAARLNRGIDAAGARVGPATAIHIGIGANPGSVSLELEVKRFRDKVAAGAEFVMTQPVFDATLLRRFLDLITDLHIPILVGILPLYSYRNAEFLHNEVPGMTIPEPVRRRMQRAATAEAAQEEGIHIAREVLAEVKHFTGIGGVYIMPPFGRYDMALKVLEGAL